MPPCNMMGDSFWTPKRPVRAILLASVVAMIVFHQSELVGLMNSEALILGWLPAQIVYDVVYLLVGVVILSVMYVVAPEPPAEHEATMTVDKQKSDSVVPSGGDD